VNITITIVLSIIGIIIGLLIGYFYRKNIAESKVAKAEDSVRKMINDAQKKAETIKKETILEAKEDILKMRNDLDKETKDRRNEAQRMEKRLIQREEHFDKKLTSIEQKEESVSKKEKDLTRAKEDLKATINKQVTQLEKISSMTSIEAKELLIEKIESEARRDASVMVREIEMQSKLDADKKTRIILANSIQRCAADHVAEYTVSVVPLPNDEMKGRIIGREGRNIRALETATGIDLIIDDTPEAVILSGFDPIRREVARLSLERLIVDGRIHPARIEEMVKKAEKDVQTQIREAGEQAMFDVGVHNLHHEIVKLLGRLKFRTSYGQNVLKHSMEVAHLCAIMAAEIGADVKIAKRAGLLHDIGKAADHEIEGPHIQIGADLAKKYREKDYIIHAIMAHHGDVEANTVEAVLVQAADAISAARPGARRETLENYVKRLEALEEIANSFNGVEKTFAIQAGREVRIIVKPDDIDDAGTHLMAKDIVKRIEKDLDYPGQIKVNVIRETRSVQFAK
jgi:ribonucrease Y